MTSKSKNLRKVSVFGWEKSKFLADCITRLLLTTTEDRPKAQLEDDVQVFVDLPPKVDGSLKSYLKVSITQINWLSRQSDSTGPNGLAVRVLWWGEDGTGSLFRPKLKGLKSNQQTYQTTAKYKVKSGAKQLSAYFTGSCDYSPLVNSESFFYRVFLFNFKTWLFSKSI
jgi:hypothetical protein